MMVRDRRAWTGAKMTSTDRMVKMTSTDRVVKMMGRDMIAMMIDTDRSYDDRHGQELG